MTEEEPFHDRPTRQDEPAPSEGRLAAALARLALLEPLVATAPVGIGLVDRDFRQLVVNDVLAAIQGPSVLSIDDFGTGYSSLSYLKRFSVDAVKIDKMFVDGLGTDEHDSALVAAIIAMAEALELTVTAEGVETAEQLAALRRLRCGRAQGFYLSRPTTAEDMMQLVGRPPRFSP